MSKSTVHVLVALIVSVNVLSAAENEVSWPKSDQSATDAQANAALVWASIAEWSSSLRSAKVDATVIVNAQDNTLGSSKYSVAWNAAFDDQIGGFRFQSRKHDSSPGTSYVRLSDRTVIFDSNGSVVRIAGPSHEIRGAPYLQLCDPRALPFALSSEAMMTSVELKPFVDLYKTTGNLGECVEEENGNYRMVVYLGEPKTQRRTLRFDAKRSFVPVELRLDILDSRKNAIIENAFTTTTEWESVGGVQLPTKIVLQSSYSGTTHAEIATKWKDVNVPLTPTDFELAALDVPVGTTVKDERLGKSIVSKHGVVFESPSLDLPAAIQQKRWTAVSLIVVNCVAIVIIAAVVWYRRRSQHG